jgi:maltose/moltooligosaccharide transporter
MAAGLLWILDAANNIALEPYRAFISDKLPEKAIFFWFFSSEFFYRIRDTTLQILLRRF